jgi:hypothetical protein
MPEWMHWVALALAALFFVWGGRRLLARPVAEAERPKDAAARGRRRPAWHALVVRPAHRADERGVIRHSNFTAEKPAG